MSITATENRLLRRFDDVWMRLKRVAIGRAIGVGSLIAVAGIAALVIADYVFELPLVVRSVWLIAVLSLAVFVIARRVLREVNRWNANQTATTLENRFPELGQSVRTAVEFADEDEAALCKRGVSPSLAAAMQEQTDRNALPLDFLSVVRTGGLLLLVGALCFLLGGLITSSAVNLEWRTAVSRAFFGNIPYTTIEVPSAAIAVREGEDAELSLSVLGRERKELALQIRETNDHDENTEWETRALTVDDRMKTDGQQYAITIPKVDTPFEYRFVVGDMTTDTFGVAVRYRLRIESVDITVTPPEYTRLEKKTVSNAGIAALEGSAASLEVRFDRVPANATLIMKPIRSRGLQREPLSIPLVMNDSIGRTELVVDGNWRFHIHAVDAEGMETDSPEYTIRMRRDKAPRVWFDEPPEELEVHTLAEILIRARVSDDFGLAQAAVVFEINNETEHTFILKDFAKALEEAKGDESNTPTTRATLEKLLPLEFFELTQRDSVNYYAWAIDIRPDAAQRTETDLRFVDIRPFRRFYEVTDNDPMPGGGGGGGAEPVTLNELIKRERALLNRSRRVARFVGAGNLADTATTDSLINDQQTIANATLRLVEFLIEKDIGGDELLFESHEVMLTVIDSLGSSRFEDAVAQEREAIKLLVEGRDTLRIILMKNPPKARAMMRMFDRKQMQKLRRPKSDAEELAELVARLRELETRERLMAEKMGLMTGESGSNGAKGDAGSQGDNEDATRELSDQMNDAAVEARDIETRMQDYDQLTDLARERADEAATIAEEAAEEFDDGNTKSSGDKAKEAGRSFGELAEQVEALLREEVAQQLADARDIAAQIGREQRELALQLEQSTPSGGSGKIGSTPSGEKNVQPGKQQMQELQEQADELAEKTKTLEDVMKAIAMSSKPEDQQAASGAAQIAEEQELSKSQDQLESARQEMEDGNAEAAATLVRDLANRMELTSEALSELHRRIVSPRIDKLMKLERDATRLAQELQELESQSDVADWNRAASQLADGINESGIESETVDNFRDQLSNDWGGGQHLKGANRGMYTAAPADVVDATDAVANDLRLRIQELVLGNTTTDQRGAVPQQYERLVERYYQVLSAGAKGADDE